MISDNRLFASNGPICRSWYFINIFILGLLSVGTNIGINEYVIPSANPDYQGLLKFIMYFIYLIFIITFFMLIDRRVYDICGNKDSASYVNLSKVIGLITSLIALSLIFLVVASNSKFQVPDIVYIFLMILAFIFALLVFILGLIPGQLTSNQ